MAKRSSTALLAADAESAGAAAWRSGPGARSRSTAPAALRKRSDFIALTVIEDRADALIRQSAASEIRLSVDDLNTLHALFLAARLIGERVLQSLRGDAQHLQRPFARYVKQLTDFIRARVIESPPERGEKSLYAERYGTVIDDFLAAGDPRDIFLSQETAGKRGSLKDRSHSHRNENIEARAIELAGDLRTIPESERKRIFSLLAQELGLSATFKQASAKAKASKFPDQAPELWADRPKGTRESPADFIIRVYGRWIKKGFARPDLRRLDAPLYQAFAKWIERHPAPAKLETFSQETRSSRVDRELEELNIREPADAYKRLPDDFRRAHRLHRAALRRQT